MKLLLLVLVCINTSVFCRQTLPDLRQIHGWKVASFGVNCPLWVSQLGQLSLPSLWVS